MRREKPPRPKSLLSQREVMRIVMLTLVAGATFFFLSRTYRNPQFFDAMLGRPVPANPAGTVPTTPTNPNREHCKEIDSKLLEAVRDKTPSQTEDNPAIYQLLCVAASMPPQELAQKARRDIQLANLFSSPANYRGQPIHIEGALTRLVLVEVPKGKGEHGIDRFYEAWIFTDNQSEVPSVVLFSTLPAGLTPSDQLNESVSIDAFFFKLLAYRARNNKGRGAPMFVGSELKWYRPDTSWANLESALLAGGFMLIIAIGSILIFRATKHDDKISSELKASAESPDVLPPPTFVGEESGGESGSGGITPPSDPEDGTPAL